MIEPVTLGAGAVVAYLGKDGLQKLLGPTAEYLGTGLRDFTEKRAQNINDIFQRSTRLLKSRGDADGIVPAKVLKHIIDEGSFSESNIEKDYLAGILVSSRSEEGRDNRGARLALLAANLSNYQLRAHYLIYGSIRHQFRGSGMVMNMDARAKMIIYIPYSSFAHAMGFSHVEAMKADQLLSHIFFGLAKESLIDQIFSFGPQDEMIKSVPTAQDSGIICGPSAIGVELFLWAFGYGDERLQHIFSSQFQSKIDDVPDYIPHIIPLNKTDT